MGIRAILVGALLVVPLAGVAQKKAEKPKVHADFYFGSLPYSRDTAEFMSKDLYRELLVAYHSGWDDTKILKELKISENDLEEAFTALDDERLAGQPSVDFDQVLPYIPVIRDRDTERVLDILKRSTKDFATLIRTNLPAIEAAVNALPVAKTAPRKQLLFQTIVSDILLGRLVTVLNEDKTLMPAPDRRRARGQRFFAWLVESDPALAGKLKRESRESEEYEIVSIGPALAKQRLNLAALRANGAPVVDAADAKVYRQTINLLCRDKLLPFLKLHRADYLKGLSNVDAGKYVATGELFAWYYVAMANGVADELAATGVIEIPQENVTYAVKVF